MPVTRDNHYVPQWYQEGFFEPGSDTLAYVDMTPDQITLPDGRVITHNSAWKSTPTSRAFFQTDLYSTCFGTSVNDEIERRLFGDVDTRGSQAVRAYIGTDQGAWHAHFQDFFDFLDIQKTRTPKGLAWLKAKYPALTQNELMLEMQSVRRLHCAIWSGGVREIVSAEDSEVKFITSDHPVTVYNHAVPPTDAGCAYPFDPGIALRGSQTLYPMDRDHCLILTNLEYAKDQNTDPLQKRTFARNYRQSLARTDAVIRERKLTAQEVGEINFILKMRARRYIGGGRLEWLYPERSVTRPWTELRETLMPPELDLFKFGGEIYVRYDSGDVHYQDQFGRTEKPREFLVKKLPDKPLRPGDYCGCGSGKAFKDCCMSKHVALRPSWNELSIRERNLILRNAIMHVLELESGKDWAQIRRELTDEKIKDIYYLYEGLWPLETDLLELLPKPDGEARAVYTGSIHPSLIIDFALAAPLYFGELIVAHPFVNAGTFKKELSPTSDPKSYRQEFLKSVVCFLNLMPLVNIGLINLIPDPCDFDPHLRKQMMTMAWDRAAQFAPGDDPRLQNITEDDVFRGLLLMPPDAMRRSVRDFDPDLSEHEVEDLMRAIMLVRESDPLAVLQEGSFEGEGGGGQWSMSKLAPNFEVTMYLAQATGASIVTDSPCRWGEILRAVGQRYKTATPGLAPLVAGIERSKFGFSRDVNEIVAAASNKTVIDYPVLFRDVFKYLSRIQNRGAKPNREAQLVSRFTKVHRSAQRDLKKMGISGGYGRISSVMPAGGIQDNTINRLLLMSSSEKHLPSVPAAYFIEAAVDL